MSTIIQGYQLRTLLLGDLVTKTAVSLPQTATANLYTVSGGNVLVTSLLGVVSTVIGGTAVTLALGTHPTTGTAETAGIATATAITSAEAGTWVGPQSSSEAAGALVNGGHAGNVLYLPTAFIVAPGTITWTTSASTTGAISWYLTYVPLDAGALVA
jgi:hypothetical protein